MFLVCLRRHKRNKSLLDRFGIIQKIGENKKGFLCMIRVAYNPGLKTRDQWSCFFSSDYELQIRVSKFLKKFLKKIIKKILKNS